MKVCMCSYTFGVQGWEKCKAQAMPGIAQGLLLALLEITPGKVQETTCDDGDRTQFGHLQGKLPLHYMIS